MSLWTNRIVPFALVLVSACSTPVSGQLASGGEVGVVKTPAVAIDRGALRARFAEHRAAQIEHLHAYGVAGQFPHNTTTAPSLHMFRDPGGRLCAVANLIQTDGRADLVEATVRSENDLEVADVHDGAMMEWIEGSGLTQEELVAIQAPAPFIGRMPKPKLKPLAPAVVYVADMAAPVSEAAMNAAIARHVEDMETVLKAGTAVSLDLAVERYVASHADEQPAS